MSVIHYCNLMSFITIDPNLFKFNKIFFKNYGHFDDSDTWLQHLRGRVRGLPWCQRLAYATQWMPGQPKLLGKTIPQSFKENS